MDELVSVIIPCFNAEKTIISTLHSLEKQTVENFEVVIVNDGSLDNTEEVIQTYMQNTCKLPIRYYSQTNQGVSCARNYGIEKARGKYITFLDADDVYHPQFLQILVQCLNKYGVDIVCCRYKKVNEEQQFKTKHQTVKEETVITKEQLLEKYLHKRKERFNFCNGIYIRNKILDDSIWFPSQIKYGEDSEFFCKYLAHCNRGGILIDNELYAYCFQAYSAMNTNYTWRRTDNLKAMQNIIFYWKDEKLDTGFADYMFSRAIWATAKDFSKADKKLYQRLCKEYDVKKAMRIMVREGDEASIKISALIYLLNSDLFRYVISKIK